MDTVSRLAKKYESVLDFPGYGRVAAHSPQAMEPAILANVESSMCKAEFPNLLLGTSLGGREWQLSQQQVQALCSAVLAHAQKYDVQVEIFESPTPVQPMRFRLALPSAAERYHGPITGVLDSIVRNTENEAVGDTYCGQSEVYYKHDVLNVRRGFFLGDGYGFGKTRTLAGIIAEYSLRGISRCVYVCGNRQQFGRVMGEINLFLEGRVRFFKEDDCTNWKKPQNGKVKAVVVLVTYEFLVDEDKFSHVKQWLGHSGYDGLMIFSKVESIIASKKEDNWMQRGGERVVQLQSMHTNARVVYSSSGLANFRDLVGVCARLGLWKQSARIQTRMEFLATLERSGDFGMDQFLMELKMQGAIVSRFLSFKNVKTIVCQSELHKEFRVIYSRSCQMWLLLYKRLCALLQCVETPPETTRASVEADAKELVAKFVRNYTEYFEMLLVSSKLEDMDYYVQQLLSQNKAIVIHVRRTESDLFSKFQSEPCFKGMPFSAPMFVLRETMISLGVAVGCPKAFVRSGEMFPIGKWTAKYESDLIKRETTKWSSIPYSGTRIPPSRQDETAEEAIGYWLPYSFGSTVEHARLNSPRGLSWSYSECKASPDNTKLARLYHELAVYLPISNLDAVLNRLRRVHDDLKDGNWGISEISSTDRTLTYEWDLGKEVWKVTGKTPVDKSYKKFQDGENRIVVLAGPIDNLDVQLDARALDVRQRAHILVDFSFPLEDLMKQIGKVHRCGQVLEPELYLMGKPSFPGDMMRLGQLMKQITDLDGVYQKEPESAQVLAEDRLFTAAGVGVISNALSLVAQTDYDMHDWLKIVGCGFKLCVSEDKTGAAVSAFLARLLRVPLDIQNLVVTQVLEVLVDSIPWGGFREFPSEYAVSIIEASVPVQQCHMYLVNMSRCLAFDNVIGEMARNPGNFYMEKETGSVFYAYAIDEGPTYAVYPYCLVPQKISDGLLGTLAEKMLDLDAARNQWEYEYDKSMRKRKYCGHNRLSTTSSSKGLCSNIPVVGKCLYKWGSTRVILITGNCSDFMLDKLEQLKVTLPYLQHAKIKLDSDSHNFETGVYIGSENCKLPTALVFDTLSE